MAENEWPFWGQDGSFRKSQCLAWQLLLSGVFLQCGTQFVEQIQ
jgi:hypothetical protein